MRLQRMQVTHAASDKAVEKEKRTSSAPGDQLGPPPKVQKVDKAEGGGGLAEKVAEGAGKLETGAEAGQERTEGEIK